MKNRLFKRLAILSILSFIAVVLGVFIFGEFPVLETAKALLLGAGAGVLKFAVVAPAAVEINGNPSNRSKAGKIVKATLYYIVEEQYDDSVGFPTRVGRNVANIPLKAGEYWHKIKSVSITNPELAIGGNMGNVGATLTNELTAVLGGVGDEILTLIEEHTGKGFYLVAEVCATGKKYVCGDGCKPMILQAPEGGLLADATSVTLKWMNESGFLFANYTGNTPLEAPDDIASDATELAVTSNPTYLIGTGSAGTGIITASGITDADLNRVITVYGSGVSSIKQDAAGHFLLVNEADWSADAGAQISFKIFKQSGEYKLIEVVGSRM